MRTLTPLALLAALFMLPSCLYTNIQTTLDTDLNQTKLGSKVGEAEVQSVLWLVAWGNGGINAAAKEGGITTVNHADQKVFGLLFGLYSSQTTVVYGD